MKTGKKGTDWGQIWKRNAVVVAIALFVCAAVYLNWNYDQQVQAGKTLGQSAMVGAETDDPLLTGGTGEGTAAARHAHGGNGVVGGAEGALGDHGSVPGGHTLDGVNFGGFQRFLAHQIGEDGGQPPCQHGFPRTRRADHDETLRHQVRHARQGL